MSPTEETLVRFNSENQVDQICVNERELKYDKYNLYTDYDFYYAFVPVLPFLRIKIRETS